jgi:cytochrome P450
MNKTITSIKEGMGFTPGHITIKAAQFLNNTKSKLGLTRPFPVFIETELPDVDTLEIEDIDVSNPFLYRQNKWQSYFKRLRDECPVHFQKQSQFGPFWSVTRYEDIMYVDKHHELFSAEPIISLGPVPEGLDKMEMFIALDPPKHDIQRKAVQDVVAPKNLKELEALIRTRTADKLDSLPIGETFDWVEQVSVDLTAMMLATLFDFPLEERSKLPYWSDTFGTTPEATGGVGADNNQLFNVAAEVLKSFSLIWREKEAQLAAGKELGFDLISLLLKDENTKNMINEPLSFLGNLALLIVGGNDTTRNSMTSGVNALHEFPEQFEKLKKDPSLIPNMVSEIIRWQTPLAYMRRVAKEDVELNGQTIKKGDKVVMWYVSGNRDERYIDKPDEFIIDRKDARKHISFGFGVHRCMGNRLAEMQLRILWEEILKRFEKIEVVGQAEYVQSNFVKGFSKLPVKLFPKK